MKKLTWSIQGESCFAVIRVIQLFFNCRYLSVMGFVINIDALMLMIPELLQVQKYVLTHRFIQDHLGAPI